MKDNSLIESFDDGKELYTDYKVNSNFYNDVKSSLGSKRVYENQDTYNKRFKSALETDPELVSGFFSLLESRSKSMNRTDFRNIFRYGFGSLFVKETDNTLHFNGESLDWKTTFSDGSSETKYSWGAVSGNSTASSLPNGDYTASNPIYTNESGMSYKNGNYRWGFKVYLDPNWALCPNGRPRGAFRIHPDGNRSTAPGTAGCIGLIDGETVSRHVYQIFRDYMNSGRTMQLNVNNPTNINDECQDNGVNDGGAPGE